MLPCYRGIWLWPWFVVCMCYRGMWYVAVKVLSEAVWQRNRMTAPLVPPPPWTDWYRPVSRLMSRLIDWLTDTVPDWCLDSAWLRLEWLLENVRKISESLNFAQFCTAPPLENCSFSQNLQVFFKNWSTPFSQNECTSFFFGARLLSHGFYRPSPRQGRRKWTDGLDWSLPRKFVSN